MKKTKKIEISDITPDNLNARTIENVRAQFAHYASGFGRYAALKRRQFKKSKIIERFLEQKLSEFLKFTDDLIVTGCLPEVMLAGDFTCAKSFLVASQTIYDCNILAEQAKILQLKEAVNALFWKDERVIRGWAENRKLQLAYGQGHLH